MTNQSIDAAVKAQQRYGRDLMKAPGAWGLGIGPGPDGEVGLCVLAQTPQDCQLGDDIFQDRLDGVPLTFQASAPPAAQSVAAGSDPLARALEVNELVKDTLIQLSGVNTVGVGLLGEGKPGLLIGTPTEEGRAYLDGLLEHEILGVPVAVSVMPNPVG